MSCKHEKEQARRRQLSGSEDGYHQGDAKQMLLQELGVVSVSDFQIKLALYASFKKKEKGRWVVKGGRMMQKICQTCRSGSYFKITFFPLCLL